MDLKESPELSAFRSTVRSWIAENLPADFQKISTDYDGIEESDTMGTWYRRLADRGWLTYRWPAEFGGPGFSDAEQIVFVDESLKSWVNRGSASWMRYLASIRNPSNGSVRSRATCFIHFPFGLTRIPAT